MGAKKQSIDPNWRNSARLLTVKEVSAITGYAPHTILDLRKRGIIQAAIDVKPFKFSPEHIFRVFFQDSFAHKVSNNSSLKTEIEGGSVHKLATRRKVAKGDLWD